MFREKALDLSHKAMEAYCYAHPPTAWVVGSICIGVGVGILLTLGILKLCDKL